MRAEDPVETGFVERDGVRIGYEVFGSSGPTLVFLPCWIIVHARAWKAQIADLAQDCRIVVLDGRGNGRSDRPTDPGAYARTAYADDAIAVMDRLGVERCTLFGFSNAGPIAALVAQRRPEQIDAVVLIAPSAPLRADQRAKREAAFLSPCSDGEGWAKYCAEYMRRDYPGFVRFFFERMFLEPHSSKQVEDAIGWAEETNAEALIASTLGALRDDVDLFAAYAALRCPVLLIHGDKDEIVPLSAGLTVADLCKAERLIVEGAGHGPHLRSPALINQTVRDFLVRAGVLSPPRRARVCRGSPRVLYLSSPIGLGHARRDLAIARALKRSRPDAKLDWLAQDPLTRFLHRAGERVHPASGRLASESAHIEAEASEHDLDVFEALRRMDEILVRNFRVLQDVLEARRYDLVVADEGWEVDHFWHEHPELKRAPLVWMTDFVGFAALPDGGERQAWLTADYNAEMVGHVERRPGVRDRSIFIGALEDVVDDDLGPDLPRRRDWVSRRFEFGGYVLGDDVPEPSDKPELRARLGLRPDETVCVVSVGGSGVGRGLIERLLAAAPILHRRRPDLRVIVVAGPRLAPESFPPAPGFEIRGFEPDLPQLLAACDVAVVQGGLSTCMELVATRTPFVYVPLQRHFEQNVHVPQRLARYGAGRRLDYRDADPDTIASVLDEVLKTPPTGAPVERDGAEHASCLIGEMF